MNEYGVRNSSKKSEDVLFIPFQSGAANSFEVLTRGKRETANADWADGTGRTGPLPGFS